MPKSNFFGPLAFTALSLSTVFTLTSSAAFAQSKVLQYDSKGRVISADQYENTSKSPQANEAMPKNGNGEGLDWDRSIGEGPGHQAPAQPPYVPGEVLALDPPKDFIGQAVSMGFGISETTTLHTLNIQMVRLKTPRGMDPVEAVKVLSRKFPGQEFDVNTTYGPSAGPSKPSARTARALAGWQKISPTCGKGIRLGMIDTGLDLTHPALRNQNISYRSFNRTDRKPGPAEHGTAIANMLVGKAQWGGLLPGAKLYAANMFEINDKGQTVGSAAAMLKAMEWLAQLKVDAVNLSIAGNDNKLVRRALSTAERAGLLLVASVGSWGDNSRLAFPAAYSDVVAVTALKGQNLVYKYANSGPHIDFAAPGTGIWSAKSGGGGQLFYGTSFAVPYLTVTAGILKQAGRTQNSDQFRKLLSNAVKDLGKPGRDNVFGYGALNVRPACKS